MNDVNEFFTGLKFGMKTFGQNLALIVNSILLLFVYIFGVGITSFFARLTGKEFLDTKLSKSKKSYWSDLDLKKKEIEEYYKQF